MVSEELLVMCISVDAVCYEAASSWGGNTSSLWQQIEQIDYPFFQACLRAHARKATRTARDRPRFIKQFTPKSRVQQPVLIRCRSAYTLHSCRLRSASELIK